MGLNRAVTLIAEKIAKGPSGRRFGADPGKPLGEHPSLGGVAVKNGRYGAYVTAGGVNATNPPDKKPASNSLQESNPFFDQRPAQSGGQPQRGGEKAPKKGGAQPHEPAALPPTVMADITGRDTDGELLAVPTEWDEEESGAAPKIRIHVPRRPQPGTAAGVGDRALLRVEKTDESEGTPYRGRVIKVVDHARTRLLGIFRKLPNGGGRLIPIDKKQVGRELNIASADAGGAADGDLVSVDLVRTRGYGPGSGKVKERLGSLATEKAVSLIAIHTPDIPQSFSPSSLREAEEAKPSML